MRKMLCIALVVALLVPVFQAPLPRTALVYIQLRHNSASQYAYVNGTPSYLFGGHTLRVSMSAGRQWLQVTVPGVGTSSQYVVVRWPVTFVTVGL